MIEVDVKMMMMASTLPGFSGGADDRPDRVSPTNRAVFGPFGRDFVAARQETVFERVTPAYQSALAFGVRSSVS
jgi:hypothetical protein